MLDSLRSRKLPGMPPHWQQFLTCMGLHFLLPMLPFAWEWIADGQISTGTLTVGGAVYVLALGTSSRNMLLFAIALLCALIYMLLDPLLTTHNSFAVAHGHQIVGWSVAGVALIHIGERFNRHVMERTPYWEFMAHSGAKQ